MTRGIIQDIGDGTTHGTTEAGTADGMTHGIIQATGAGTIHGITLTTAGTTHTGDIITIRATGRTMTERMYGTVQDIRPGLTGCSEADPHSGEA